MDSRQQVSYNYKLPYTVGEEHVLSLADSSHVTPDPIDYLEECNRGRASRASRPDSDGTQLSLASFKRMMHLDARQDIDHGESGLVAQRRARSLAEIRLQQRRRNELVASDERM